MGRENELMQLLNAQSALPATGVVASVTARIQGQGVENPAIAAEAAKIRQATAAQPKPQEAPRGKATSQAVPRGKKK